jgi:CheY-like chemotaxis protein
LSEAGYAADTAITGAEGLVKAQTSAYSAILLDLILPDMAGWDVLHSVRTSGPNRDTPVIIITIVAEKEVAKAFPVQDYLVKPVAPETLVNSLRQAAGHANALKKKVLVVDDDASARKIASVALQCTGYEPVCHASGQQGLSTAAREEFAAVVLDLLMPEIDGFAFLERFRQIASCRNVPVIVWTHKDLTAADRQRLKFSAQSIALKDRDGIDAVIHEVQRHVAAGNEKHPG